MPFLLGIQSISANNSVETSFEQFISYPQQDIEEASTDNDSDNNLGYVFAVFAIVWGVFFAFMILLMRKQTRINAEMAGLKQLLENKKNPQ